MVFFIFCIQDFAQVDVLRLGKDCQGCQKHTFFYPTGIFDFRELTSLIRKLSGVGMHSDTVRRMGVLKVVGV